MATQDKIRTRMARAARNLALKCASGEVKHFDIGQEFKKEPIVSNNTFYSFNDLLNVDSKDKIIGPSCALGHVKWEANYLHDEQMPWSRNPTSFETAADLVMEANDHAYYDENQADRLVFPLLNLADVLKVKRKNKNG